MSEIRRGAHDFEAATLERPGDRAPRWEELEAARGRPGGLERCLDVAGLRVSLVGLDAPQARWFDARYGVFGRDGGRGAAHVRLDVGAAPAEGFLQTDPSRGAELYRLLQDVQPDGTVRAWSYRFAGWFHPAEGSGRLWLSDRQGKAFETSLENYLRVVYASLALGRGGFLLHSAGVVRHGRAHLLFGPSGSGKSTASRLSQEMDAAIRVISDDLVLVLPEESGGGVRAVSSPFRGWYAELPEAQESFPVAGFYRLVQAPEVALEPLAGARALSELVGSLPFVTDRPEDGGAVLEAVGRALDRAPAYRLRFRKDPSFWEVLEGAGTHG